ncbi:MAG: putative plasmid stability protein StbB [Verrucomicrobiota bacterium]|jgi:predicted nucleic acid-binding protein
MPFLLDTVTISELRKGARMNHAVRKWQESEVTGSAYLSVITMNEIRYGISKQMRRDRNFADLLEIWYSNLTSQPEVFPLLGVDLPIAELAAHFRGSNGLSYADSLIAATAKVHGLTLATRNTADFEATGIALFNPWEFQA